MDKMNNTQQASTLAGIGAFGRKYWKKGLAGILAVAVLGGAGFAWNAHRHMERLAARDAARSQLVASEAAKQDITLISADEAQAVAAEAIGTDESQLTYRRVSLTDMAQGPRGEKQKGEPRALGNGPACADGNMEPRHAWCNGDDEHERGYGRHRRDGQHDGGWCPGGGPENCPAYGGQADAQGAPMRPEARQDNNAQPQAEQQNLAAGAQPADAQQPRPMHRMHPAYQIDCAQGNVKYRVLVDAVTGDTMMCDVL